MKKNVLIGVTGGIAAYKALDLVSSLKKKDLQIKVMMTKNACEFVSPLSFRTLSGHPCEVDLFDKTNEDPISHISLAKWADLVVLVPCTANVLAKVVHGICDDLVSTTFLACHCPKMIAPAMNVHMYENPVTQRNLALAKDLSYQIIEPEVGHLACNDTGKGKLANVKDIEEAILHSLCHNDQLNHKHVLISAGPTQEALDPVRFISNHSSGKQGYAIARAALNMGAKVTLVSGPVNIPAPKGAAMIFVQSAEEMFEAMKEQSLKADYIIMAAAVADYRPSQKAAEKIKKSAAGKTLQRIPNADVLAWRGQHKKENQILCGFAMETSDLDKHAKEKLEKKNCDLLIGNNLTVEGAGFKTDTNIVSLLKKDSIEHLPKCTKEELGIRILETMKEIEEEKKKC